MFLVQGDDDIYLCVNDGGRVSVEAASATGRTHPEIADEVRVLCVTGYCLGIRWVCSGIYSSCCFSLIEFRYNPL